MPNRAERARLVGRHDQRFRRPRRTPRLLCSPEHALSRPRRAPQRSCYLCGRLKEGLEGIAARSLVLISTISPVGRVALELVPLPD
jgi:hypothetical protein